MVGLWLGCTHASYFGLRGVDGILTHPNVPVLTAASHVPTPHVSTHKHAQTLTADSITQEAGEASCSSPVLLLILRHFRSPSNE